MTTYDLAIAATWVAYFTGIAVLGGTVIGWLGGWFR